MEPIVIHRADAAEDEYGNPIEGEAVEWATFRGLVAPNHGGEEMSVGRAAVITGYTIYVENQGPTGIRETDLVQLPTRHGDRMFPVDGLVAEWRKRDGTHKGDQFAVRVVQG